MKGLIVGGATIVGGLPLTVAVAGGAVVTSRPGSGPGGGPPSAFALSDIPAELLSVYQEAAAGAWAMPWAVLAAIGSVESSARDTGSRCSNCAGAWRPDGGGSRRADVAGRDLHPTFRLAAAQPARGTGPNRLWPVRGPCVARRAGGDAGPEPSPPLSSTYARAGDGNRTRVTSLEGWDSATELHPRDRASWPGRGGGI